MNNKDKALVALSNLKETINALQTIAICEDLSENQLLEVYLAIDTADRLISGDLKEIGLDGIF
jgi:hypothetical protein